MHLPALSLSLPLLTTLLFATLLPLTTASTPDGLTIEVTESVSCNRKTKKGDSVDMHYRGTLAADGSEFDASYNRGAPLRFELGSGRVIKG